MFHIIILYKFRLLEHRLLQIYCQNLLRSLMHCGAKRRRKSDRWHSQTVFTARRCASAVYALVRPSVCPSQASMVSKRLDEASWVLAWRLPSACPTLFYKEIVVSPEIRVLPLELCPKLRTWKISPRQVDRVVNKTRRRRRLRSSFMTTPIRQSTSRGCLLQVDEVTL